jgi:hypothetical protein
VAGFLQACTQSSICLKEASGHPLQKSDSILKIALTANEPSPFHKRVKFPLNRAEIDKIRADPQSQADILMHPTARIPDDSHQVIPHHVSFSLPVELPPSTRIL